MGVEKAAKGSIATTQIEQLSRALGSKNSEQRGINIALVIGGNGVLPAIFVNCGESADSDFSSMASR